MPGGRTVVGVLAGALVVVLAPAAIAQAAVSTCHPAWPQFERTSARAGSPLPGSHVGRGTIGRLRRAWRTSIGTGNTGAVGIASSPLVNCGVVYVAAADGRVYAFDASTGRRLWRRPVSRQPLFGATIADSALYVAGADGILTALSTADGHVLWTFRYSHLNGGAPTPPTIVGATVYVIAEGDLQAVGAANGRPRWRAPIGGDSFLSIPAATGGLIYVGTSNGLEALDAASGAVRWTAPTSDSVWSSPTVANNTVFVGSNDHDVYAFDASTGLLRWSAPTADRVYTSAPIAVDGTVYVGSLDKAVHALDAATGASRWTFLTGDIVTGSAAVAGGVVFIGSTDGTLYAVDGTTGVPLWSDAVGAPIGSSPAVDASGIYITTARSLIAYTVA